MPAPRVSVILPSHNRVTHLPRSVGSVLQQGFRDLELVIVDDGSTDGTQAWVEALGDERVRYLRHENNRGAGAARNTGIAAARGELLAFQDSDDEWLPGKLARQVGYLDAHPDVALVSCTLRRREPATGTDCLHPAAPLPAGREPRLRRLLLGNFMWTQTWLVRAGALRDLRFDERLLRIQDWDLALSLAQRFELAHLAEVLVVAYATPGSLLSDARQRGLDLQAMVGNQRALLEAHPDLHATYCRWIASWASTHGTGAEVRHWARRAVALAPRDPRNVAAWLLSLLGRGPYAAARMLAQRIRG